VELFQAGTTVACTRCNATQTVPNTSKLKELSGDKYPLLSPLNKVIKTTAKSEPPFDGTCHRCGNERATCQVPIQFDVMVERHVQNEGGIRPTLTGVELFTGASEEQWQSVTFPLLLCTNCNSDFAKVKSRAAALRTTKNIFLLGLLGAFLYFAYFHLEEVAALVGIISVIGALAWVAKFRDTKKGHHFALPWLKGIRWVPEAIAAEDEYNISVYSSIPYDASKST